MRRQIVYLRSAAAASERRCGCLTLASPFPVLPQVQLSDLAGNAMSLPVVLAAQLAAFCVAAFDRARRRDPQFSLADATAAAPPALPAPGSPSSSAAPSPPKASEIEAVPEFFRRLQSLCDRAFEASVLCTCESSGGCTTSEILRCAHCALTICRQCTDRFATASHDLEPVASGTRDPSAFERELWLLAPATLRLHGSSAAQLAQVSALHAIGDLSRDAFRLERIARERGYWRLQYATPVAQIRVTVGALGARRGVCALLHSFAATLRGECGAMPPVARLVVPQAGALPAWEVCRGHREAQFALVGTEPEPSFRAELGLMDFDAERWPRVIKVQRSGTTETYQRQRCRGTCAQACPCAYCDLLSLLQGSVEGHSSPVPTAVCHSSTSVGYPLEAVG